MTSIRRASTADLATISLIHLRNMRRMVEMAPPGLAQTLRTPPSPAQVEAYFADMTGDADSLLLVAETESGVEGFLSACVEHHPDDLLDSPYLTIEFVEIIPGSESRGLATALLQAAEQFAREQDIANVDLSVWQGNGRARSLYEHLGYAPIEIRMVKLLRD